MTASHRLNIPKTIALLIFIAAAAFLIDPVFAKDATASTTGRGSLETRKTNTLQRIDAKKQVVTDRATAIREKIASREAVLKEKLQKFRDQKKAEVAERVNTNLNKINQKQTGQMQDYLDRMSSLLDKLEARVNQASPDARTAIASASSAVSVQAEKDYTLQITTESRVRADAQETRDTLHKDLQAARAQVVDAKQAVANAIRAAKSGKVVEAKPSGQ